MENSSHFKSKIGREKDGTGIKDLQSVNKKSAANTSQRKNCKINDPFKNVNETTSKI